MRGWMVVGAASLLAMTGCALSDSEAATLPPLAPSRTDQPSAVTVPPTPAPLPHRAWYYAHSDAIHAQLDAVRTLRDDLAATDDDAVLTLVCVKGVDLDQPAVRAAYDAPDAHPQWTRVVDLTRWMMAGCRADARQSVDGVLPKLDRALSRFDTWRGQVAGR